MLAAAADTAPREAVGFLFGEGDRLELRLVGNRAEGDAAFEMDEREVAELFAAEGRAPAALFHSHPTDVASPSTLDMACAEHWPGLCHVIVSLAYGPRLKCWRIFAGQALPEPVEE